MFSVTFNQESQLLGYDLTIGQKTVQLTLYWKALASMNTSYTVFTHLLDAQNRVIAQQDNVPVSGTRPTTNWLAG